MHASQSLHSRARWTFVPLGAAPIASAAVGVGAGVAGVVQRADRRRRGERTEDHEIAVAQSGRKAQALVSEHLDHLTGRAHAREGLEEVGDRLPDLRVGVEDDVAGRVVDKARGQRAAILAAPDLVEDPAAQSRLEDVQLGLAHRSLQPEQQAVVEVRWIVHAILVEDQRVGERADLQQPVPVGVVPRQTRDLEPHDDARAPHAHLGDQALKALAPSRRGARLALIAVDDDDPLVGPAECRRARAKRVLALRALDVLDDLPHRGLPDVQVGRALEMAAVGP